MPSSTSNSDFRPGRRGARSAGSRQVRAGLLCLGLAGLLTLLTAAVWRHTPLRTYEALIARETRPAARDYFLGYSGSDFEHHIYYHDLDGVMDSVRSADVLVLGNSRTMYAFTRSFVEQFWSRYHLRCYVLGFGQGEQDVFPAALMDKFRLRPRWVIVNGDIFFTGRASASADHAMRYGRFPALVVRREGTLGHALRRQIHRWLPHVAATEYPTEPDWITYRSRTDGTWFIAAHKGVAKILPRAEEDAGEAGVTATLQEAESFARCVRGHGAKLLLTFVPSPVDDRAVVREVAARLGVPLIMPEMDEVMTVDGSHMTPASSERFISLFLDQVQPYLAGATAGGTESGPGN
jgi:hypothetical protein